MVSLITTMVGMGGAPASSGNAAKPAEVSLPLPTPQPAPQPVVQSEPAPSTTTPQEMTERRSEAMRQALSAVLPKFFYPVTDVRFTIYKDSSGQYITKFTNIVSGEVSQIPEPDLLNMLGGGLASSGGYVQTVA